MWNRLRAILADFIQQADLVLLGLCCAATVFGMVLIASATHYMGRRKNPPVRGRPGRGHAAGSRRLRVHVHD